MRIGTIALAAAVAACGNETTAPQPALRFVQVSAGGSHTCGVTTAGAAYCWGANNLGQLGDGTRNGSAVPVPVRGGLRLVAVSASVNHSCALTASGAAYCWGENLTGDLGNGSVTDTSTPTPVAGGLTFAAVSAGQGHSCGLTLGGAAYCWGLNASGQLGRPASFVYQTTPMAVGGALAFTSLSAGGQHSCGVGGAGAAYCWGQNYTGQLGDSTTADKATPTAVAGGLTFAGVSASPYGWDPEDYFGHTCGVTTTGAAYCWGLNYDAQLGDGTRTTRSTPAAVLGGLTFTAVSAGGLRSCGLTAIGAAYCWGRRSIVSGSDSVPVAVPGGVAFATISAGLFHTCALTAAGAAYCWGINTSGQLGDGTTAASLTPVRVAGQP